MYNGYGKEERRRVKEGIPVFRWYRCHGCGWEHVCDGAYHVTACGNAECPSPALHVHSDVDGEKPLKLPKHRPGCSNQNMLHPSGAYIGVEQCGCNKP